MTFITVWCIATTRFSGSYYDRYGLSVESLWALSVHTTKWLRAACGFR